MTTLLGHRESAVRDALRSVDDPEYPGISIVDLGLLERVSIDGSAARVGLIPTFSGCPALSLIEADVIAAVGTADGIDSVQVEWLKSPAWSVDRVTASARTRLNREFTVAVRIGSARPECPRCGAVLGPLSLFGPSRCRATSKCPACGENVEVMRS